MGFRGKLRVIVFFSYLGIGPLFWGRPPCTAMLLQQLEQKSQTLTAERTVFISLWLQSANLPINASKSHTMVCYCSHGNMMMLILNSKHCSKVLPHTINCWLIGLKMSVFLYYMAIYFHLQIIELIWATLGELNSICHYIKLLFLSFQFGISRRKIGENYDSWEVMKQFWEGYF